MFLWLILGGLAVAALGGGAARKKTVVRFPPGKRALVPDDAEGDKYGLVVQDINPLEGWQAVFIEAAQNAWLEWGACYYDWQQDITKHETVDEHAAAQHMVKRMHQLQDYVLTVATVVGWLVKRICFRAWIPATKIKIRGEWYFVPQSPSMAGFEEMKKTKAGWALPGWNPGTSRFGFSTRYPEWPLEWPPPAGMVTGGWVRNLGDITGTGFDTWQLISNQDGSDRSFPMMTEKGWRAALGFSDYKWGGSDNSSILSMFHNWRGAGAEGVKKGAASRTRAFNRYQKPA